MEKINEKRKDIERVDVALFDERFYKKYNPKTKLDEYAPSVTYLLSCVYPIGYGLTSWIGDVGNKRADEIKEEAGEEGSYVHEAIEKMLNGDKIPSEDITGRFSARRSLKIHRCLKAFLDWYDEYKPETLAVEHTVWNDEYKYAGTLDYRCKIKGETWIIDFKTSKTIQPSMKVQLSAYNHAETGGADKQAILHLGNTTKKKYSFLEVEFDRYFEEFKVANQMFQLLYPDAAPNSEMFPKIFSLTK